LCIQKIRCDPTKGDNVADKKAEQEGAKQVKHSAQVIGEIVALYATMFNGQLMRNPDYSLEEKLAAVLGAADLLRELHMMTAAALAGGGASPAYLLSQEKIKQTADLHVARMLEGCNG
jgi:hypothetical protein